MPVPTKLQIGDKVRVLLTEPRRVLHGYHGEIESRNGDELFVRFTIRIANTHDGAWINQRHLQRIDAPQPQKERLTP